LRVSQEELSAVKVAMDTEKKARIFRRYQALYLFLSGKSCREVAEIVGITKDTVSNIHQIYRSEGLKGIPDKPKSGRPSRLNGEQKAALKEIIVTKSPSEVGFPSDWRSQ